MATTSPDEVREVVDRSRVAFLEWAALSPRERRRHLKAYRRVVLDNCDRIAGVVQAETGKVAADAYVTDIMPGLTVMDYYARNAHRLLRRRPGPRWPVVVIRSWTEYQPRGVAAVISPYNAPFFISMMGVFTAIAAGCSAVLKPSELTPLSGQLVADLACEAGLPSDLVQVVHGDGTVGAALVASGVDIISFTGSPSTGRKVSGEAARSFTPVVLELGGKDAMLLLEDADAKEAARCAVWGSTLHAGQTCISVERVYVPTALYASFIETADEAMDQLTVGTSDASDIGPITDLRQVDIIERQIADAVAKGAKILRGGERVAINGGVYFQPTLLTDVDHSMEIMRAETFGPVLAVMEVPDEATALQLANDSAYGLHGSVWSRNKRRAREFASRLDTGTVAVNDHLVNAFTPGIPFGGIKDSGIGSESGPEGIRAYCHPKGITSPRLIATTRILLGWRWMPRRVGPTYWKRLARILYRW